MLTDNTVRKLLPMVNNRQNEERIAAYVSDRVTYLYRQLEQCGTFEEMKTLQGQIKELKRLLTLKDEVSQRVKEI